MARGGRGGRGGGRKGRGGGDGPLSRRDLQELKDYGYLPRRVETDEVMKSEKPVRVIDETDEARSLEAKRGKKRLRHGREVKSTESAEANVEVEEEDGGDWEAPSAFSQLLSSLRKAPASSSSDEPAKGKKSKKERLRDESVDEDTEADDADHRPPTLESHSAVTDMDAEPDNDDDDDADQAGDSEDEAAASDGNAEAEDGQDKEDVDLYDVHFGEDTADEIAMVHELHGVESGSSGWPSRTLSHPVLGTLTVTDPADADDANDYTSLSYDAKKPPSAQSVLQDLAFKVRVCERQASAPAFSALEYTMLNVLSEYQDILFNHRTQKNAAQLQRAVSLHIVNHVLKTRDRVLKNASRLQVLAQQGGSPTEFRDQGFTRPRVLILTPFRHTALSHVMSLINNGPSGLNVENRKRFMTAFGPPEESAAPVTSKPSDWHELFDGNADDCFRVGLKWTRRTVKLFSDFYSSDVLVCSPLGLRLIVGAEGDDEKLRDYDFLSSIEVLVVDRADVLSTQNWDHVVHILSLLNRVPKSPHGCDFSRVRNWCLDGHARFARQSIFLSDICLPEINNVYSRSCVNFAGKLRCNPPASSLPGVLGRITRQQQQIFHRVGCDSPAQMDEAKIEYFTTKLASSFRAGSAHGPGKHLLIVVPTYMELVLLRGALLALDIQLVAMSEYTSGPRIARARSMFKQGRVDVCIVTERFHFYRRLVLQGARHVVFYALPDRPHFYKEFVEMIDPDAVSKEGRPGAVDAAQDGECTILYTKFELFRLERVVGAARARTMLSSERSLHLFM